MWPKISCTILLYSGPIIFKGILSEKMYNNFLTFYAIRIFCDPNLITCNENIEYADKLCVTFVIQFKRIYKTINISYNIHSLIHISADVKRLGVLDSFSAFPFENFIGNLKTKI